MAAVSLGLEAASNEFFESNRLDRFIAVMGAAGSLRKVMITAVASKLVAALCMIERRTVTT